MSEFHNDATHASDPGGLNLSDQKLRWLQPELFGWRGWFVRYPWIKKTKLNGTSFRRMLAEHVATGDSRAAVVAAISPLVVAAYTDELDCVALLSFPDWLTEDYRLKVGSRLLTVNTYGRRSVADPDLIHGPQNLRQWNHFYPIIAEFTCEQMDRIDWRKRQISEAEWKRTAAMAMAKILTGPIRDGRPLTSGTPARG